MTTRAYILCALMVTGCVADPGSVNPGTGDDDDDGALPTPDAGSGPVTQLAGDITADATWAGDLAVTDNITIKTGVTITVMAGAHLSFADSAGLIVEGTL